MSSAAPAPSSPQPSSQRSPRPTVPQVPAKVLPAATPQQAGLNTLMVGVVVVAGLYLGREVLVPITLAVLLSFVLGPLVDLLRRLWLGRVPSILLAVVLALGVILALGGLIGTQLAGLVGDIPQYRTTVRHKVETVRGLTLGRLADFSHRMGRELGAPPAAVPPGGHLPARADAPGLRPDAERPIPVRVEQPEASPLELAERILAPVASPLSTVGIIFIVSIFVLMQKEDLRDRLIRLFGSTDLHRTTLAMDDAARRLSKYFLTQLAINTVFGTVIGLGLLLIGVPSPLLWGIMGALLRFVPYIGAPIAALLPVALAAAVSPGWAMTWEAAALFAVTELVMSQAVEPLLYGHSTGLSPVAVVVSAIFWTWLWGSIGLLLSTPLTVCLVVLGRHIKRLEFLDVLLGDRPALTPVQSFYQRMLAGDPDEAQDYAEALLRERSLSAYYDEVALPGLQMAAGDALRGALNPAEIEGIRHAIDALLDELASHDDLKPGAKAEAADHAPPPDERPPAWRDEAPVLCLAGRGPLDEAASAMLAQLLGKHGLRARLLPHEAAARGAVNGIDAHGVAMVCVSYLDIGGSPSHLRHLLRRLRQHMPGARLLVGLWPNGDPVLHDRDLGRALGADVYVTSLREAVSDCVKACRRDPGTARAA